jgi:hypothetical protein
LFLALEWPLLPACGSPVPAFPFDYVGSYHPGAVSVGVAGGGPLRQPFGYAQIGGLGVATFIRLLLAPVLYSIFVLDLQIVKWEGPSGAPKAESTANPKGELP